MKKVSAAILVSLFTVLSDGFTSAEGLPVSKYLEDPEHKNEILGFYLDAVFTGINLANERIKPPLFCMDQKKSESAFSAIDKRILQLQKKKQFSPDMTVDSIMMDILIEEYPCK
jgi:hypothetical protein